MQKLCIAIGASFLYAPVALAETESFSFPYTYDLATDGDVYPRLTIPGFDDMNGSRVLTRVDVRVEAEVGATVSIENMNSTPLSDWTFEGQHLVLTSLERENPPDFGPFAFLGGLFIDQFTSPLEQNDGVAGSGNDHFEFTDLATINSVLDMDPSYLPFFNGGGEIKAVVGPFTEFFFGPATQYDPDSGTGDATVRWADLTQSGTFTLSYEYTVIPEPASLIALGGIGVIVLRRR